MKRISGLFEVGFDALYLTIGLSLGCFLFFGKSATLIGSAALVLICGDAFHLIPRIQSILGQASQRLIVPLGRGKQITSITMTVFYLLLWQLSVVVFPAPLPLYWTFAICALGGIRIVLCLMPQNQWLQRDPPLSWGILRNIPFLLMGIIVASRFFLYQNHVQALQYFWLAIVCSFLFYLPVVLWAHKYPKIGMLMLPKTCMYLWMLVCFLSL